MEIIVIGGQDKVNLEQYINNLQKIEPYDTFIFPELSNEHPSVLFNRIQQVTKQHIDDGISLYCVTYSDHVLNAIRVVIKNYGSDINAVTHQVCNDNTVVIATIDKKGCLSEWVDGVWDQWDKALMELV